MKQHGIHLRSPNQCSGANALLGWNAAVTQHFNNTSKPSQRCPKENYNLLAAVQEMGFGRIIMLPLPSYPPPLQRQTADERKGHERDSHVSAWCSHSHTVQAWLIQPGWCWQKESAGKLQNRLLGMVLLWQEESRSAQLCHIFFLRTLANA